MPNVQLALPPDDDAEGLTQALAYYRVSTTDQANTSFDDEGFSALLRIE